MSQPEHKPKNYFSSSAVLTFKGLDLGERKVLPRALCLASEKQNNTKLTLLQFMENQEKKHLSTEFNKKEVDAFLKEKDAAMEEINMDEDIPKRKETEKKNADDEENNRTNKENNLNNVNSIIINQTQSDNKSSHILIFKGTFGKDEYNRLVNEEHKHHHHHHHHHQHHHHNENN